MDEETFRLNIRKFLKLAGVGSHREMGHAVENPSPPKPLTAAKPLPRP